MQTSPRGESLPSSWRAFNACSEWNRPQPAPLIAYTSELGVFLTARRRIAVAKHTGEKMDTTTLLVIVLAVLLLGGGGFFYRRRA